MKKLLVLLVLVLAVLFVEGCSDAEIASHNISKEADYFRVYRRVIFYNGITDKYILVIEGYCSIDTSNGELCVTVKTDNGKFLKHFLRLSDNVTYVAEQIEPSKLSEDHYKIIFKPSAILPDVELK